jgi:hypothetical protein
VNVLFRIGFALLVCVASACTASYPTEPTKGRPVALYLAYSVPRGRAAVGVLNLPATNAYGFVAYTINTDGAFERVSDRAEWSSSNDGIVRVQAAASGAAARSYTAVAPGDAMVIARLQGLEAVAPVLVVENDVMTRTPRIDVTAGNTIAVVGSVTRGIATLRPAAGAAQDVSNRAAWTSSDPGVASVSASGSITALGKGTTIITANVDGMVDWLWFSVLPGS